MKLNLGENIRTNRRRLGMTQEQLAERLGTTFQSVSRWENGTTYPDMELLPDMARLFSVTVDDLLGCGEPDEKIPYETVEQELTEAIRAHDWTEAIRLLRLIRWEYFDDVEQQVGNCRALDHCCWQKAYEIPEMVEEVRLFVEDYLRRGKIGNARNSFIHILAQMEDEEHIGKFLNKYSSENLDFTRDGFLLDRYYAREEWDKYRRQLMLHRYRSILEALKPSSCDDAPSEPEYWRQVNELNLQTLHLLNRITPDEAHLVTGDGSVDIWAGLRLEIGTKYAAQLSILGETDRALTVLEDMADLTEKLIALPNHAELTCRAPILRGLKLIKSNARLIDTDELWCICLDAELYHICDMIQPRIHDILSSRQYSWNDACAEWFDPIRSEPRFQKVVERFRDACRCTSQPGDVPVTKS